MQNKNESDHQNPMELMPEPIVSGSDLAVHAFSLMKRFNSHDSVCGR